MTGREQTGTRQDRSEKTVPASWPSRWRRAQVRSGPRRARVAASVQRFPAPCSPARSFRGASGAEFFPQATREIGGVGVAAELQGAHVSDDGPTVARRNLRGVAEHSAETVGDNVVDVAVGRLAETVLMKAGRMLHAAHANQPVAVALQPVAGGAENLVAIFAAFEQLQIHRQ